MAAAPLVEAASVARFPTQSVAVSALVLGSLAVALVAPVPAMVLGPLLLGAPHLVGDLRTLWWQRPAGIDDRVIALVLIPLVAMTGARASGNSVPSPAVVEVALGCAAVLVAVHAGLASARARTAAIAVALPLAVLAATFATATQLALAHAHNVVAFVAWMAWTRRPRAAWGVAAAYVAAWIVVLALPVTDAEIAVGAFGATASTFSGSLAPGLDAAQGAVVVRSFVFAQLVHYGVWTFAMPRVDASRERRLPRGAWIAVAAACAVVPLVGAFDPLGVRGAYLSLVVFHGWFELAVFGFVAARRFQGVRR